MLPSRSASAAAATAKSCIPELSFAPPRASPTRASRCLFAVWGVRASARGSPGQPPRAGRQPQPPGPPSEVPGAVAAPAPLRPPPGTFKKGVWEKSEEESERGGVREGEVDRGVDIPPLVDPGPITCNTTRRAGALLLCNRTLLGGRPPPNGTLLVHTPTFSNVDGHIWIYSIFQLPQPVAITDTPPEKKCVVPIIVSCIFTNTTAALSVHSSIPPAITTTTATLHAMPRSDKAYTSTYLCRS